METKIVKKVKELIKKKTLCTPRIAGSANSGQLVELKCDFGNISYELFRELYDDIEKITKIHANNWNYYGSFFFTIYS